MPKEGKARSDHIWDSPTLTVTPTKESLKRVYFTGLGSYMYRKPDVEICIVYFGDERIAMSGKFSKLLLKHNLKNFNKTWNTLKESG